MTQFYIRLPLMLLLLCQLFSLILTVFQTKALQNSSFCTFPMEKSPANIDLSITWKSGLTLNYYSTNLHSKIKSGHKFCPFMCLYAHRQNHYCRPAVHSSDVIHIHRSACKARSAFTRLNPFLSLSLHHYLSASLLWHHSFHVSFTLFFNSSLYHLLMLFSPLFQPSALLADLILPCLFMFLFPAGLWGLRTISVFQADFLALLSQSETQPLRLVFSLWQSSSLISAINNWKFCIGVLSVIQQPSSLPMSLRLFDMLPFLLFPPSLPRSSVPSL